MKRYRNLAVIAVVTTLSLGVFYSKVVTSESNLPVYYIHTDKGNPKSASDIEINANIYKDNTNRHISITTKGNDYRNYSSIFDIFFTNTFSLKKLNDLQKEEKSFMRGKNADSSFYLDNDYVWHADVRGKNLNSNPRNNGYKLYIDGLDLQGKDRYTFTVSIPKEEDYSYIGVEDVQLIGKDLIVTTFQNKNFGESVRCIYKISISKKKVIETMDFGFVKENEENYYTEITNPSEVDQTQSKPYYVYKKLETKQTTQSNGEVLSEELHNSIHILNLKTLKEEKLNITKEQLEMSKQSEMLQSDNMLYFITQNERNVIITKYSLDRNKIESEPVVIPKESGISFSNSKIINGNLYTITNNTVTNGDLAINDGQHSIYIFDLATGKTSYEGTITVKNTKSNKNDLLKHIDIYGFTVK